ncbi:hypothetical protein, partial [Parafrankia sp. EUN1f]|uniref:hypothetical protein n=1 Tax=Parafrankia sp. EUN1f TaxID=102897 RepID=UPI0012F83C6F
PDDVAEDKFAALDGEADESDESGDGAGLDGLPDDVAEDKFAALDGEADESDESGDGAGLDGLPDDVAEDKFAALDGEADESDEFGDGAGLDGLPDDVAEDKFAALDGEAEEANPLGESDQVTEADSAQAADSGDAMPPSDGSRDDRSAQDATEHKAAALDDEPSLNAADETPRQPDDEGSHADSELPDHQPGDADHHESDHLDEIPDRTAAPDASRTPERLSEERLGEEDPAREELPPEAEQGEADTVADPLETQSTEPVSADADPHRADQNPVKGDDEKTADNNEIANRAEPTDTDISDPATDELGIGEPATEPSSEAADGSAARDVTEELAETIASAADMLLEGAEAIAGAAGAFFDGRGDTAGDVPIIGDALEGTGATGEGRRAVRPENDAGDTLLGEATPSEEPTGTSTDGAPETEPVSEAATDSAVTDIPEALVDGGARGGQGGDVRGEADTNRQARPGAEHGDVPAGDGDPVDPGDSNNGPDDDGASVRGGEESARDRTPDGDRQERPDVDENRQDNHPSHRRDGSDDGGGGSGTDADSVDGLSDDERRQVELDVARAERNGTAAELAAEIGGVVGRLDGLPLASLVKAAMDHGPYFGALANRLKNWFGR